MPKTWYSTGVGYHLGRARLMVQESDDRPPAYRAQLTLTAPRGRTLTVSGHTAEAIAAALDRRLPGWRETLTPLVQLIEKTADAMAQAQALKAAEQADERARVARLASAAREGTDQAASRAIVVYDSRTGFTRAGAALTRAAIHAAECELDH
jgi:hypothetical protein